MKENMRTTLMREIVRDFMEDHLGASQKQIVAGTGLTRKQVEMACRSIRREWMPHFRKADSSRYALSHRLRAIEQMKHDPAIFASRPEPMGHMLQFNQERGNGMAVRVGDNVTPIGHELPAKSTLLAQIKEIATMQPGQPWPKWYNDRVVEDQKRGLNGPDLWKRLFGESAAEIEQLQALAGKLHKTLYP